MDSLEANSLSEEIVLITYRTAEEWPGEGIKRFALRASLWVKTEQGWQIRLHQATATGLLVPETAEKR